MVKQERLLADFLQLVEIDSLSFKERELAGVLSGILERMNLSWRMDNAGEPFGGNCGNLICNIPGTHEAAPILLMAHMDTVDPGIGKHAVVENGVIRSDGSTILGSDDVAGIVCILEAVRCLAENNLPHGDITLVFSVAEEAGMFGAEALNYGEISADYGFVMDGGGPIQNVYISAPSQEDVDICITGKAAHAGVEPEKGINAIQVASKAISMMNLGRLDAETTANIGMINGGIATNIVCEQVQIQAEVRSLNEDKLEHVLAEMEDCVQNATQFYSAAYTFEHRRMFSAFRVDTSSAILEIIEKAGEACGFAPRFLPTGGGSDTNTISGRGIEAVTLSVGIEDAHSVGEYIEIQRMVDATEFLLEIIRAIP